jgi:pimeloyl-ACP methyl ester carboxylesterase
MWLSRRVPLLVSMAALAASPRAHAAPACEVGAYRGPAGDFVTVFATADSATTNKWRYRFRDGEQGTTPDAAVQCARDAVVISRGTGAAERWPRIAFRTTATRFRSAGVTLAGLLIEPPDAGARPPLVVLGHGSERTPAIGRSGYPYVFAAQGIAAFVFDKRGTGASGGKYTQSFAQLADDMVAASVEAKRLARGRFGRFGLFAASQGGWVAPRAANAAGAQFVIVGFGLVLSPLEEDAEQVQLEIGQLGGDRAAHAAARKVTDATGAVIASHFTSGYDELAAVRTAYAAQPWFARIKGEFTGDILASDEATLRRDGPARMDNLDIDWRYDAIGELRKVQAPQLWILAGADREAPNALTIDRLRMLQREGRPIELVVFPATDHGIVEFVDNPDGTRTVTRVADGYFRMLGDWVKRDRHPPYGRSFTP